MSIKQGNNNPILQKVPLLITCIFIIVFTAACYAPIVLHTESEVKDYQQKYSVVRVLNVETNSGETIRFHENYPASVVPSGIKGKPLVHIDFSREKSRIMNEADHEILQVVTDENKKYNVISTDRKGYVCINFDYVTIPFEDISQVLVTTANVGGDYSLTIWDIGYIADWVYITGASAISIFLILLFILNP